MTVSPTASAAVEVEQNVLRLEVAVDVVLGVQVAEGQHDAAGIELPAAPQHVLLHLVEWARIQLARLDPVGTVRAFWLASEGQVSALLYAPQHT